MRSLVGRVLVGTVLITAPLVGAPSASASTPLPTERIVTVPGPGRPVEVRVWAGDDVERQFLAYDPAFVGGAFVASGTVDDDVQHELILGPDKGGGPHVRVFSLDGEPRSEFMAYEPTFRGGVRVAAADVNGDGRREIVTGPGRGGGPHVRVLAASGIPIVEFMAFEPAFAGGVFVAAGNFDDDAADEIVVGAGEGGGPHVRVFDFSCAASSCAATAMGPGFYAFDSGFSGGVRVAANPQAGSDIILTAPGPGGGPHVRGFTPTGALTGPNTYVFDPGFTGGVFPAATYIRADWFMAAAGTGGGPHVKQVDYNGSVNEFLSFYAYESEFGGGVRLAIAVRPSASASEQ